MSKIAVKAIAAMSSERVIGNENALPWNVPEDMKHFVALTKGHTVLMGRKTFASAPMNSRPLPKRLNVIVTRSPDQYENQENVTYINEPLEFIERCKAGEVSLPTDTLWVIGGANIYEQTIPLWDEVHLTIIKGEHPGDTFFPPFEEEFELKSEDEIEPCTFRHYVRK